MLGILATAVLSQVPAVASGEPQVEAHLVMPEGAELRTHPDGPVHVEHGSFLDGVEDLDVHRQGGAVGLVHRGGDRVLVTAVRLRDEGEAARALTAFGDGPLDDAITDLLPDGATNSILVKDWQGGDAATPVEVVRATGRDLVVFAQLDMHEPGLTPFTREVVEVHLAAFPAVTPPAGAGSNLGSWLLPLGVGLGAACAALVTAVLLGRRTRRRSMAEPPLEPDRGRVIW